MEERNTNPLEDKRFEYLKKLYGKYSDGKTHEELERIVSQDYARAMDVNRQQLSARRWAYSQFNNGILDHATLYGKLNTKKSYSPVDRVLQDTNLSDMIQGFSKKKMIEPSENVPDFVSQTQILDTFYPDLKGVTIDQIEIKQPKPRLTYGGKLKNRKSRKSKRKNRKSKSCKSRKSKRKNCKSLK